MSNSNGLTARLTRLMSPAENQPSGGTPEYATPSAKKLDTLLTDVAADAYIHPGYRQDLMQLLTEMIDLATQLAAPNYDFDSVMKHYTNGQLLLAQLLMHATASRPRINGYGLTAQQQVLPFFAMSMEEAERMRRGMPSLPLNVVGVEVIHRSGFRSESYIERLPPAVVTAAPPPPPEPPPAVTPEPPPTTPAPPPEVKT